MVQQAIKKMIGREGPITFAKFMEMALYDPQEGYYTSQKEIIGKAGDFYTSVHVDPLFGEMIGEQVADFAQIIGESSFQVVEYGAGKGYLALDILNLMREKYPRIYSQMKYTIIEAGPGLKQKQKDLLASYSNVSWIDSLGELPKPFYGCIISNELVDAFPVHLVKQDQGYLKEIFVDWQDSKFTEVMQELSDQEISQYFARLGVTLQEGQRAEAGIQAVKWIYEAGQALDKGFILTIDYGYQTPLLYHPVRFDGTIMCYQAHQVTASPYINVGAQDITAHANFSALEIWGEDAGLHVTGFTNQMKFLFNLGIAEKAQGDLNKALAVQHLVSPEGMGGIFKVLIQHKGLAEPRPVGLIERKI